MNIIEGKNVTSVKLLKFNWKLTARFDAVEERDGELRDAYIQVVSKRNSGK